MRTDSTRNSLLGVLLCVAGCGGGSINTAVISSGAGGTGTIEALPLADGATLTRLADNGSASGTLGGTSDAIQRPVSITPADARVADDANFFGSGAWSLLRVGSSNNRGVIAGNGIVDDVPIAWTWDGRPALRYSVPAGHTIGKVVGPADDGSFAADTYNPATFEQEILLWQANGSRSVIYRIVPVKAGMNLFGMASNGWLGGIERDGILLTPKIYDGSWRAMPFDLMTCSCEAMRINARGQMLLSPRPDLGSDARGYIVSSGGATLLPQPEGGVRYTDLNDVGDVVGNAAQGPVLLVGGVLRDLNAYANSAALGWRLLTADAINNRRQVVGTGVLQGRTRWYRLSLQ